MLQLLNKTIEKFATCAAVRKKKSVLIIIDNLCDGLINYRGPCLHECIVNKSSVEFE